MPDTLPGSDFARVPPHNLDAERSALGGVLVKPVMFDELATTLGTDDFFLPAHREIFDAMMEISRRQQPIDVVSLGDELKSRGSLARLEGGAAYLIAIANAVPTARPGQPQQRLARARDRRNLARQFRVSPRSGLPRRFCATFGMDPEMNLY
ncbi:MAG: DnaB-like helicase N-terminal domain-containing protein [Polyangia bacterium]